MMTIGKRDDGHITIINARIKNFIRKLPSGKEMRKGKWQRIIK